MTTTRNEWAKSQLTRILPLDDATLTQILDYTSTLSTDAAAEHLKSFLGDSPKALEFISSYNARRQVSSTVESLVGASSNATSNGSSPRRRPPKQKAPLHKLPSRQVEGSGNVSGAYRKADQEDYIGGRRDIPASKLSSTLALSATPVARQTTSRAISKMPPSAAGSMLQDLPNVRTKQQISRDSSRASSPAPKMKINVQGGVAGHGASTTLEDLDSAIRTLELQTNPTLTNGKTNDAERACVCNATRHPLLTAAPNCINCGKIICIKEGLGPCTFCHSALLAPVDLQAMIETLRQERGQERQHTHNASSRRADVASVPKAYAKTSSTNPSDTTLQAALAHRNTLLKYQTQNAQRTTVHDEAADFTTPASGTNQWASPVERAKQLRQQQKALREIEWNARPEYEKRRTVLSIELGKGGKVTKRTGAVERPKDPSWQEQSTAMETDNTKENLAESDDSPNDINNSSGTFSKNPLLKGDMIKPVWKPQSENPDTVDNLKGKSAESQDEPPTPRAARKSAWRKVQDDNDDNEAIILDGGVYGRRTDGLMANGDVNLAGEEHPCG